MKVSAELHRRVLERDGQCFIARIEPQHQCYGRWGLEDPHASTDLDRLTVDHVHLDGAHMGKRAPSDERHLVAMCWQMNIGGPSTSVREAERDYLRSLYGMPAR